MWSKYLKNLRSQFGHSLSKLAVCSISDFTSTSPTRKHYLTTLILPLIFSRVWNPPSVSATVLDCAPLLKPWLSEQQLRVVPNWFVVRGTGVREADEKLIKANQWGRYAWCCVGSLWDLNRVTCLVSKMRKKGLSQCRKTFQVSGMDIVKYAFILLLTSLLRRK